MVHGNRDFVASEMVMDANSSISALGSNLAPHFLLFRALERIIWLNPKVLHYCKARYLKTIKTTSVELSISLAKS